jgi:hypothetical protein
MAPDDDGTPRDRHRTVEAYYRALDAEGASDGDGGDDGDGADHPALESLLAAGFVHDRPDRTFEGRDAFVRFMREERPVRETVHEVEGYYDRADVADVAAAATPPGDLVARGTLRRVDGDDLFRVADAVTFDGDGRIVHLVTYTD